MFLLRSRLQAFQVLHSGAKANGSNNSVCNIFPARPPFGSQFLSPALSKAWRRPASVLALPHLQLCSGGGSRSTAAASRRLRKEEEEETKERLLPGLSPTIRTVLAPQAAFLPAKPFRRQAELSDCPIQFLPPQF